MIDRIVRDYFHIQVHDRWGHDWLVRKRADPLSPLFVRKMSPLSDKRANPYLKETVEAWLHDYAELHNTHHFPDEGEIWYDETRLSWKNGRLQVARITGRARERRFVFTSSILFFFSPSLITVC